MKKAITSLVLASAVTFSWFTYQEIKERREIGTQAAETPSSQSTASESAQPSAPEAKPVAQVSETEAHQTSVTDEPASFIQVKPSELSPSPTSLDALNNKITALSPEELTEAETLSALPLYRYEVFGEAQSHVIGQEWNHRSTEDRARIVSQLRAIEDEQVEQLKAYAAANGLIYQGQIEGKKKTLVGVTENGEPMYEGPANVAAAESTGANLVRQNSSFDSTFGADVDGSGLYVNIYDSGLARAHDEFRLPDTTLRMTWFPNVTPSGDSHSDHVAGTIGAHGYNSNLKGMAPAVWINSFSGGSTNSEITGDAMSYPGEATKAVVGSESMGDPLADGGGYGSSDYTRDDALVSVPYYLHFEASGNSGSSYETINSYEKEAKNAVIVGSVGDVTRDSSGNYVSGGSIASYSSRGPVDDGRIKPDFVGNGQGLTSTNGSSNGTSTMSGTSMATPNVSGSAILLQDYYNKRFSGHFMRATTLRALLSHTTDDFGNTGPDYTYGWGMVNVKKAGDLIKDYADNPGKPRIIEGLLSENETDEITFTYAGSGEIRATVVWHEYRGSGTDAIGGANQRGPNINNDLDLRIVAPSTTEHQPWVMPYVTGGFNSSDYNTPATTGDNTNDNIEQVLISSPSETGTYTVKITHKGSTLYNNDAQPYSLIITGIDAAQTAPTPSISNVSTLSFTNGEIITITGTNFRPGATVTLSQSGQTDVQAYGIEVFGDQLVVRADMAGKSGTWNVTVTNPDGQTATSDPTAPGSLIFSSSSYSATEGDGTVTISVKRTGGMGGSIAVDYATSNGTATAGSDYTATSGSIGWSDGDNTTQTFTILITDDSDFENSETVSIALSNPTGGASLGSPNTATLTINENDINTAPSLSIASPANSSAKISGTSATLFLDATASDDGNPGPMTYAWSQVSGAGTATFGNSTGVDTTVSFDTAGSYTLRITVDDGLDSSTADIQVQVGDPAIPSTGLLLYYPFDETSGTTAADSAGSNNGTTSGATQWAAGYIGNAIDVDLSGGTGAFEEVTTNNSINVGSSTSWTAAAWVKLDTVPATGNNRLILQQDNNVSGTGRSWLAVTDGMALFSYLGNAATEGGTLTLGQWHHVALTIDTSTLTLYLDGTAVATNSLSTEAANGILHIGQHKTPDDAKQWDGLIDEFTLHNSALNASDVLSLASRGGNIAPTVNAGNDTSATTSGSINLAGSVSDDGLPSSPGAVTTSWSQVSGPASATITNASSLTSAVSFPSAGTYVLRLSADDGEYITSDEVSITVTGAIAAGYSLTESVLNVAENAGTGTFTVVLDATPTSDVVFNVSSSDTAEATVSPTTLTFTTANWNTVQTVTVTGVDDALLTDDSATVTVSVNDASSADEYDALADQTVAVTLTNDDSDPYLSWSGGANELDDDNNDGIDNLMAYALGASNTTSEDATLPTASTSSGDLIFTINDTQQTDVLYEIEVTTDLQTWYRVAYKNGSGSWTLDTADDETAVYANIGNVSVDPSGNGAALTHTSPPDRLIIRLKATK